MLFEKGGNMAYRVTLDLTEESFTRGAERTYHLNQSLEAWLRCVPVRNRLLFVDQPGTMNEQHIVFEPRDEYDETARSIFRECLGRRGLLAFHIREELVRRPVHAS